VPRRHPNFTSALLELLVVRVREKRARNALFLACSARGVASVGVRRTFGRPPLLARSMARALAASAALSLAAATFSYGSAAAQDPLPACDTRVLCNGVFCADVCVDGSIRADPWLVNAIRFQYNLTRARSWRWGPILGTHNGFISRTNGMGLTEDLASALYAGARPSVQDSHVRITNQRYGPKSLLSLGVRELELDLWDTLVNDKDFEVVVCHSPVPDPAAIVDVQAAATALGLGNLTYNPFAELCSNHTVTWAFSQVAEWLAANPDDVAEIFLDNRVASWNVDLITAAARSVFNASLLTPVDLRTRYGGAFPSRDVMLRDGKRVIIESNDYAGNNYSKAEFPNYVFWPTTWTDQPGVQDFAPGPNCTLHGTDSWYGSGLPRLLDGGDLAWEPTQEDENGIILKPVGLADLVNCAVNNIGVADVTPAALTGWVWSWAAGEPAPVPGGGCAAAAMALVRGQWRARPCATALPALCRAGDNRVPAGDRPEAWSVTAAPVAWADAPAACAALGAGWAFDVPRDGRENALVARRLLLGGDWAAGLPGVWLNVQTSA